MAFSLSGALGGAQAGSSVGGPWGAAIGGVLGAFSGSGGSSARAAAHAARVATEAGQYANRQARSDLAPFRSGGQEAAGRLSQLMGLDNFDRNNIADQLRTQNPDVFSVEAKLQHRARPAGSEAKKLYGEGNQYLINGQWVDARDLKNQPYTAYTDEQNKLIDSEIGRIKSSPDYGSLTKEFSLSDYVADPGYQFRLEQGNKAIDAANSKRGNFYSGAALKEANKYNSGMASQEYGSAYDRYQNNKNTLYNRLSGLSSSGQNAVNAQIGAGQNQVANSVNAIYSDANAKIAQNQNNTNQMNQGIAGLFGGGQSSYGNISSLFNNTGQNGLPWQTAGNRNPNGGYYTGA